MGGRLVGELLTHIYFISTLGRQWLRIWDLWGMWYKQQVRCISRGSREIYTLPMGSGWIIGAVLG